METNKMDELYKRIANKIVELIPVKWEKVYLYAEVMENDSSEVYFYFKESGKEDYVYSLNIPKLYNVNERSFKLSLFDLNDYFEELQGEFKLNGKEVWSHLTMLLERSGKFKIDFSYDDVLSIPYTPTQRQVLWKYKYLGIYPSSGENKILIDDYLKNNKS